MNIPTTIPYASLSSPQPTSPYLAATGYNIPGRLSVVNPNHNTVFAFASGLAGTGGGGLPATQASQAKQAAQAAQATQAQGYQSPKPAGFTPIVVLHGPSTLTPFGPLTFTMAPLQNKKI
jgi:hypothetical protein